MPTRYLRITGKVQGVFYRVSAKKEALKLGVTGWIRNTANDDVEAVITGDPGTLDLFIAWCKIGPDLARVSNVLVEEREEEEFTAFVIEH